MDRIAAQMASIRERFPGLEFHRAELAEIDRPGGETSRVLHVYAKQASATGWRDLQVRVAAQPPHRLTQVVFIAEVTEPIYLPNGDITTAGTLAWLNSYVDRLAAEYDLAGSFLVAVGESVVVERAFGFADAARKTRVGTGTLFNLASASKMFTALACARLVEDRRLSYADPIVRFFPDFPDTAFARRATVGHLLSHTSGVAEYWTDATDTILQRVRSTAEVLPLVYRAGTRFQPGTRFEYSNSNFILAGLIVEKVSGRTFEAFTAGLITGPLGLQNTGPFAAADPFRSLAHPLQRSAQGWTVARHGVRGTAAGGWFSTPRDMLAFLRALETGRIVPRATKYTMVVSRTRCLWGSDKG
jgi:CubicO group peptidase (beta-lactamase class C family)